MTRLLPALAAIAFLSFAYPAFAQPDAVVEPPVVATEVETTTVESASGETTTTVSAPADQAPDIVSENTVVIPTGSIIEQLAAAFRDLAISALGLALLWASTLLPATLRQFINAERIKAAEQVLGHAVDFGFNAVKDATKEQKVTVNVGSKIVAEAAQYVVDNAPGWLITFLGGRTGIENKIVARIDLTPPATAHAVLAGMPDAVPGASVGPKK
jgi:hypothetical protein